MAEEDTAGAQPSQLMGRARPQRGQGLTVSFQAISQMGKVSPGARGVARGKLDLNLGQAASWFPIYHPPHPARRDPALRSLGDQRCKQAEDIPRNL